MEVISLNTNKQKVAVIDSYKSFIWNDRYEDLGDFELYIPASEVNTLANIHQDYYIQCSESDRTMIVEKVNYKTDLEDGSFVLISGHSLEAILQRRIVWNDDGSVTQVNSTRIADPKDDSEDSGSEFYVWKGIEYLLKAFIIDPEACGNSPLRKIPNFVFIEPEDLRIANLKMPPCSYQGDNLYDVILSICKMFEISFKITLNKDTDEFEFSLFKSNSHLASQTDNPYVCFSSDFDNLIASDSSIDMSTYKNMAYYKGNGSKYVIKEFDDKDITMETGFVRVRNNKIYAVNTDFGQNDDSKNIKTDYQPSHKYGDTILDWTPEEFNDEWDEESPETYQKYSKLDRVSRDEYNGALLTEDRSFYLSTEPVKPAGDDDDYSAILLFDSGYEEETVYYECTNNSGHQGPWNPNNWKRIGVRVTWGHVKDFYKTYEAGTEEEPKEHKEGDIFQEKVQGDNYNVWECIEDHTTTGNYDSTKWIPVVTHDVTKQMFHNLAKNEKKDFIHTLFSECKNWVFGTQYGKGSFVTFNDSRRTGKITIYRKTESDAVYSTKKQYPEKSVVWYKPKGYENRMYVRKKYKSTGNKAKKGVAPSNKRYWTKLKDKYKTFDAQQWEALDDIEIEQYDVYGSVQDNMVSGMDRRELYVDATSVPSTYDYFYNDKQEETVNWVVTDGVYKATIKDMALAELTTPSNRMTRGLDAEIEYDTNFKYRRDYEIGDVVEVRDIYGYIDSVRVKEFIISHDENGIKCYPVFEAVEASTITTRLLEVGDLMLNNTTLVKIPESTRFKKEETIAVAVKSDNTYYLKSFIKKVTVPSEFKDGKEYKRDLHIVAWITTDDIYTNYEKQEADDLLKSHPTMVGEPLFYVDVDTENNIQLPGILFPSWCPPNGVDLGEITEVTTTASQYKNILLANI